MGAEGGPDELDNPDPEDAPFSPVASVRMCSTRQNSLASMDIEILPPPKSDVDHKGYPPELWQAPIADPGAAAVAHLEDSRFLFALGFHGVLDHRTSPRVLETKFGFPYTIACQLVKGATWLIPSHVIFPNAKGLTTPAPPANSVVNPPANVNEDPGSHHLVATKTATVGLACASSSGNVRAASTTNAPALSGPRDLLGDDSTSA
ncbi:hypothetical protein PTTG_10182 [Puccinia triticina 1-1 BBBD Race 1]|uniref:Uncharacterized protein n=1 Tax=Puccinia triticina (isolate 1-1 / race 1 (BBBD)) TaxID=630390 RepID=A0A180G3B4_PUCT1|nr:hypothetical protein PTTG_10182 [Puccinia triticina 1-1 BBBD Race 1]